MKIRNPHFGFFTIIGALLLALSFNASAQTIDEELRYDDGTADGVPVAGADLYVFNRFTPPRYPATLKAVRIFMRRVNNTPTGTPFRLVIFGIGLSVPSVSFQRPANFAFTQNVTVPDVSTTGEFVEFTLSSQIQISGGDVYVGFQQLSTSGPFVWIDGSEPYPLRSYAILPGDNNVRNDFFLTQGFPPEQPAVNFMIRVVLSLPAVQPPIAAVSAASYFVGDVAGESIIAIFGTNLAPGVALAATVPLPTTLNGTTVRVTDSVNSTREAGLFFVSSGQVNLALPPGLAEGSATLTVTNGSGQSFTTRINLRGVVPGVFNANANGQGVAAAELLRVRANGSLVYEPVAQFDAANSRWITRPIVFGPESEQAFLVLYGTGWRNRTNQANVLVNVQQAGGAQLPVTYAGTQGANVGLDQINVSLPRTLAGKGTMYFRVIADARAANLFTLNFQ